MPKILVTGMSGTGKTSALDALSRLGYRVVDTDDAGWRDYHRDPASTDPVHRGVFVWNEDRMSALLGSDDPRTLFVAGCVNNQADFYDRFDAGVLLSAPARVILDRVAARTTNPYGKSEVERAVILDDLARTSSHGSERATHELDATRPFDAIVADLVAIAVRPPGRNLRRRGIK